MVFSFLKLEEYDQPLMYLLEAEKHPGWINTQKHYRDYLRNAIQSIYQRQEKFKGTWICPKAWWTTSKVGHTDVQYLNFGKVW